MLCLAQHIVSELGQLVKVAVRPLVGSMSIAHYCKVDIKSV